MKSNAILGLFTFLVLSAPLTAHSSDFTEGFKEGFNEAFTTNFKKSFIESCSAERENSQALRDFCVCMATLAVEYLTVAELTALVVDRTKLDEQVPKCRYLLAGLAPSAE